MAVAAPAPSSLKCCNHYWFYKIAQVGASTIKCVLAPTDFDPLISLGMIHLRQLLFLGSITLLMSIHSNLNAQADPDAGKSVAQVVQELGTIADFILNDTNTDAKIEQNKRFIGRLTHLLERPESYDFGFDSLKTVSRLYPQDNSFRIFTWYIIDNPTNAYYSEDAYYYFGLVQRKFVDVKGKIHYLVIPLMELEQSPKGLESIVTDNLSWFGALYYKPKDTKYLPTYDGFYYKLTPAKGDVKRDPNAKEEVVTYIPGKYRGRSTKLVNQPQYSNYKRVKTDVKYYLLMGWNGWDNTANYKVVDVLSFDETDSMKVNFGAPIFYFDRIPKARALFKYADYATFSLNYANVRRGPFKMMSKRMLVYDHLSPPVKARPTDQYDLGPDGSYDALNFFGKYGGYFEWYRNVTTTEKSDNRKHAKEMAKLQAQYAQGDSTFVDYARYLSPRQSRMGDRAAEKAAKKEQKELEKKLKAAGIVIPKGKKPEDE